MVQTFNLDLDLGFDCQTVEYSIFRFYWIPVLVYFPVFHSYLPDRLVRCLTFLRARFQAGLNGHEALAIFAGGNRVVSAVITYVLAHSYGAIDMAMRFILESRLLLMSADVTRANSRFAPSQWETALLCNDVSHWLDTGPESALVLHVAS